MLSFKTIERKLLNMVKRGLITIEKGKALFGQCSFQETVSGYEGVTPYGLASKAKKGCLVVLINVGADPSNKVGFEYDNRTYFNLEEGEVCLYHPTKKQSIHLKNDGSIEIKTTNNVNINVDGQTNLICPNTNITGDVMVTGKIEATGTITSQTDCVSVAVSGKGHKHGKGTLKDSVPLPLNSGETDVPS